jgi:hypothetical protein
VGSGKGAIRRPLGDILVMKSRNIIIGINIHIFVTD